jgi:uncharacterized protein YcgL (UPF0745 family)
MAPKPKKKIASIAKQKMAPTPKKKITLVAKQKMVPTPKMKIVLVASVAFMPKRDEFSKIPKEMKQQDLLGFMKMRAPPVLSIEVVNHGAAKYSCLHGWQNSSTVMFLPIDQQKELANLCIDLDTANVEKEWEHAAMIQVDMDSLRQLVDMMHKDLKDLKETKGALKESLFAFLFWIKQGKHVEAGSGIRQWLLGQCC